jgi:micrococcal nuclease
MKNKKLKTKYQKLKEFSLLSVTIILALVSFADAGSTAKVKKVFDGDTILLENGVSIRYIGVDAPETHHPRKPPGRLGPEATEFNRQLVAGREVRLEYGARQKDKYGRTLAYVYSGDTFVNEAILRAGLAIAYGHDPENKYSDLFLEAEKEARDAGKGIWGLPLKYPEKEYVASKYKKPIENKLEPRRVFHRTGCKHARDIYKRNKMFFKTINEALDAGFRPCAVCNALERK